MDDRTQTASAKWMTAPNVVLALLCASYLILYINRVNISIAAPLLRADLNLSNTQLGLAFSAFAFPYALFQLAGGWIGDRFGARLTLILCSAVVAAATMLTGAAAGFPSLFLARILLGFGEGAAFPTATRAMASWTPKSRWGFAQGITHSFARIGNALTPPLIVGLLVWVSWRGSFVIVGLLSLAWLCVWTWYFRDDPREHFAITATDLAMLPPPRTIRHQSVPWIRLARRMFPVTVVDFCYGWTLWLFLSWIPAFFFENYHLKLQASALFSAGVFFAGVVGDTVGGLASDRLLRKTGNLVIARRYVIVVGFAGAFVFLLPVILIHNLTVAAICLSLAFFFAELIVAPIWSMPMDIAPQYAGSASGMMNFGFGIAGIISPSSFGYLVDKTGSWVIPFIGSVMLLLIGAVLASRLRPDLPFEAA
ncbi:MAG TPA: MFS transporter [Candidatus Acidoferrales bacterium]|nr:MFS transporter [Candidatus Acidoferrales bacterium]